MLYFAVTRGAIVRHAMPHADNADDDTLIDTLHFLPCLFAPYFRYAD